MSKKIGPLDAIRYGTAGANVKANVTPKMWKKIVALAHKRGFTVAGATSGNPDPLKERTHSSLLAQARKQVNAAYDPTLKQLDAQGVQLNALADKRKADNESYQQWMLGKQAEYNTAAAAAHQQYQGYLDKLKTDTEAAHQQAQAGAQATVQGMSGTVSDIGQSSAIQGLSADTARATGLVDNARLQTAAMQPTLENQQNTRQQAVIGQGQAAEAKRISDLNTGLTQLGDQKFKVLAAKAGDVFKTYFDSLNQQVDIANSNRNYNAAADKLGLDAQKFAFDQVKSNRDYGLNVKKLTYAERDARARRAIDYEKIRRTEGQKAADRKLKRELAKQKANGTKTAVLSPKDQAKAFQDVTTASGMLNELHAKHPNGTMANGQNFRQYLRDKGVSDVMIDVAQDLYAHGGKLSAFGRKQALALGILHPYNQFGKADTGTSYQGQG